MSKPRGHHLSQAGNYIHGTFQNHGVELIGNNISVGGNFHLHTGISERDRDNECKRALRVTITDPVDDRAKIISLKGRIIEATCDWITTDPRYRNWRNVRTRSQLLWVAGGQARGKTMLAIFLTKEFDRLAQRSGEITVLYYFCDRQDKRDTAVHVLRGLILRLIETRKELIKHLIEEYEVQKDSLFGPNSIEALWRVLEKMVRDPLAGQVYCIIDGLDSCTDESLRRLVGRIRDFFLDEPQVVVDEGSNEDSYGENSAPRRTGQKIGAGFKLMLVSREEPDWLIDQLAEFPRVPIGGGSAKRAVGGVSSAGGVSSKPAKKPPKLADIAAKIVRKQTLDKAEKQKPTSTVSDPSSALSAHLAHALPAPVEPVEQISVPLRYETVVPIDAAEHPSIVASQQPAHRNEQPSITDSIQHSVTTIKPISPEVAETVSYALPPSPVVPIEPTSAPTIVLENTAYTAEPNEYLDDKPTSSTNQEGQEDAADLEEEHDEDYNPSLRLYIEVKIEELSKEKQYATEVQSFICAALEYRGDGTFLWVDFAIQELKKVQQVSAMEDIVNSLPAGLDEMYINTLLNIPPSLADLVAGLLRWTVCAKRPMDLTELIVALNLTNYSNNDSMAFILNAITACGNMLSVGEEDLTVNLVHSSLVDFLTGDSSRLLMDPRLARYYIQPSRIDGDIANFCISYLEQGAFNEHSICQFENEAQYNQHVIQYPFLPYAASFWPDHLRDSPNPNLNLSSPFFQSKSKIRKNWWHTYWSFSTGKGRWVAPRNFTLVHLAAYLNLVSLGQALANRGELRSRLDKRDSHGSTAIDYSIALGHIPMFQFLIGHGAKQDPLGESILELACRKGQRDMVELLINMGFDVNSRAKQMNAMSSLYTITRWLPGALNEGVDLNRDNWSMMFRDVGVQETPLHICATMGHLSVMEFLIDRGASLNAGTTKGFNPIHAASYTGQTECVQYLIDRGANFNALTTEQWLPIHYAALRGKVAVVELFLNQCGTPIDSLTSKKKTALHQASYAGQYQMVQLLVERGANLEAKSYKGETSLHLATRHTKPQIVELLLSLGAMRDVRTNEGVTPLQCAQASNLNDAKECARILQTYGMEGYVPWQPPQDPNAVATNTTAPTAAVPLSTQTTGENGARRASMASPPPSTRTFGHSTVPRAHTFQSFQANISVEVQHPPPAQQGTYSSYVPYQNLQSTQPPPNQSTFSYPQPDFNRTQSDPVRSGSKFSYDSSASMNQSTGQDNGVTYGAMPPPNGPPPPYAANPSPPVTFPEKSAAWTSSVNQMNPGAWQPAQVQPTQYANPPAQVISPSQTGNASGYPQQQVFQQGQNQQQPVSEQQQNGQQVFQQQSLPQQQQQHISIANASTPFSQPQKNDISYPMTPPPGYPQHNNIPSASATPVHPFIDTPAPQSATSDLTQRLSSMSVSNINSTLAPTSFTAELPGSPAPPPIQTYPSPNLHSQQPSPNLQSLTAQSNPIQYQATSSPNIQTPPSIQTSPPPPQMHPPQPHHTHSVPNIHYMQAPPSPMMTPAAMPFQSTPVTPYATPSQQWQNQTQTYQPPVSPMQPQQQFQYQHQQQPAPPSPLHYTTGLTLNTNTSNYPSPSPSTQFLSPMTQYAQPQVPMQQQMQQPVQSAQFTGNSTASTYNSGYEYSAPAIAAPYNPNLGNVGVIQGQQQGSVIGWQGQPGFNNNMNNNMGMLFAPPPTTGVLQKKKSFLGSLRGG